MTTTHTANAAKEAAAAHAGRPATWLKVLGKAGYAARGVVYVVIGFIALTAAFGGEKAQGSHGALEEMLQEPFGAIILSAVAIGLVGYSVWRFVQAFMDTDHHGTDAKGLVVRAGLAVSGTSHILLAIYAGYLIFYGQQSGSGGDSSTQEWTAWLMAKPWGIWMVGIVGLCVIGAGVAQIYKGATAGFEKYMAMDQDVDRWARPTGMVGLIARGVTFCIIGSLFIVAAYQADPSEARGLGGALETLQSQPYGPWLLAVVAVGLLAFAAYSMLEAFYRRIEMPSSPDRPNKPESLAH